MSPGFPFRYSARSLVRNGYRSVLAVFCVAVGVMAIVALQLAASTIRHSLLSNIREANGGDVTIQAFNGGLGGEDLAHIADLQRRHLVSDWTASLSDGVSGRHGEGRPRPLTLQIVDPARYPLVGQVRLVRPGAGSLRSLIGGANEVVVDTTTRDQLGVGIGDQVQMVIQGGQPLTATVTGVSATSGLAGVGTMFVSADTYQAALGRPLLYQTVNMTTPGHAEMQQVKADLQRRYPVASVRTTDDLLQSQKEASQGISRFLELVGLLALLVGGIGIANTMQVLLSRRRIEIAMLKTSGYRRRDLYLLFGLEAAGLGLLGGAIGALLGTELSFGVTRLVENLVNQRLEPQVDLPTVLSGLAVGVATALTFGLLPIVKAAEIRPLAVIRDAAEGGWRSRLLTAGLVALLGALFTLLALAILGDLPTAIFGVAGTLVALGLLSLGFAVVAFVIGALPVPERVSWGYLLLVTPAVALSALVAYLLPGVGVPLLLFTLAGYGILLAPRRWKATARLAFRGVGRQPGRTATTLVALFVGVFCVGLILIVGQDLRGQIDRAISNQAPFNVVALESGRGGDAVGSALRGLPGLQRQHRSLTMSVTPVAVRDEPVADFATRVRAESNGSDPSFLFFSISSVEGDDLAHGQLPSATLAPDPRDPRRRAGRLLTSEDAGTGNVLGGQELLAPPWNLRPGDTVTLAAPRTHATRMLTLVGFVARNSFVNFQFAALQGDSGLVSAWAGDDAAVVYSLKVDPGHKEKAIDRLNSAAPDAIVVDITDFGAIVDQILQNLLVLLTALASLALLAGVVIIANAVALAMLERRREIGIMKSVGYESRGVLSQVLVENALVGGLGGTAAIALVALSTALLGRFAFRTSLGVGASLSIAIIVAAAGLAAAVACLVAWAPTRIRPLEVLRYE